MPSAANLLRAPKRGLPREELHAAQAVTDRAFAGMFPQAAAGSAPTAAGGCRSSICYRGGSTLRLSVGASG
ncbi:MAG TPA: hypothetical protein VFR42_12665, partial [Candidatus Acidoferrum sp.]|nr:hypothetical protein [Candidatus Acidoferrum sp.]